jgi:hypothetical protein
LQLNLTALTALVHDVGLNPAALTIYIPHRGDGDDDLNRERHVLDYVFDALLR